MTPLIAAKQVAAAKARREINVPRLAWTTSTGDAPLRPVPQTQECPGCDGETSKSVGVMLGCTFCAM